MLLLFMGNRKTILDVQPQFTSLSSRSPAQRTDRILAAEKTLVHTCREFHRHCPLCSGWSQKGLVTPIVLWDKEVSGVTQTATIYMMLVGKFVSLEP